MRYKTVQHNGELIMIFIFCFSFFDSLDPSIQEEAEKFLCEALKTRISHNGKAEKVVSQSGFEDETLEQTRRRVNMVAALLENFKLGKIE